MNQQEETDIRLWAFIEGRCSADEQQQVRQLINTSPLWKAAYNEALLLHKALTASAPAQPSLQFTQNVMGAIGNVQVMPATRPYINVWIVRSIAAIFIILIVSLLAASISSVTWSNTGSMLSQNMLAQAISFNHISFSTFWPYFIVVNIIVALALVDAVYHQRHRKLL